MMVAFGSSAGTNFHYNFGSGYYSSTDASIAIGVMIVFLLIFAAVFALMLMWSISAVRLVGSVKKTIDTPQVGVKGAKLFGVLNIVLGILTCFGAFSSLVAMFGIDTYGFYSYSASSFSVFALLSFINMLSNAVFIILLGTLSLGYDKYIKIICSPYSPLWRRLHSSPFPALLYRRRPAILISSRPLIPTHRHSGPSRRSRQPLL